jgi:hypothetical protein
VRKQMARLRRRLERLRQEGEQPITRLWLPAKDGAEPPPPVAQQLAEGRVVIEVPRDEYATHFADLE